MNKKRYLIAFIAALFLHALFLWRGSSFYQSPENGLVQGNSSLEVGLIAMQDRTKVREEPPQLKETTPHASSSFTQKKKLLEEALSEKKSSQGALGSSTLAPSYLNNPQPTYPENERKSGHEGIVLLRVAINAAGKIESVLLEHSSGYPLLDQRALETVTAKWRFRPAMKNKEAFSSEVLIPIHFSLGALGSVP